MKKRVAATGTLMAILGLALAAQGCAGMQNTNGNANAVAVATPSPTPDKAAIEAELTRIENDWPRILKERDAAAVRRIEADDILLVYPDGADGNKEQDLKDIESGSLTADSWEISEIKVNVLDADAAVVRLRTTVKNGVYKAPDGRTQNISGQYRSMDTFVRRNGEWKLVASATVPVKNPVATTAASTTPMASPTARSTPAAKGTPVPRPSPARPSPARPTPRAEGTP
jgi:hypothetical protein